MKRSFIAVLALLAGLFTLSVAHDASAYPLSSNCKAYNGGGIYPWPSAEIIPFYGNSDVQPGAHWGLASPGDGYCLVFQTDGNLVEYRYDGHVMWASNTWMDHVSDVVLQNNGNTYLLSNVPAPNAPWQTGTNCAQYVSTRGARQTEWAMQADGNFVVYCDGNSNNHLFAVWANGA